MKSADFSKTCEGCVYAKKSHERSGTLHARCFAPGDWHGYEITSRGRFLPYVPAWCPELGRAGTKKPEPPKEWGVMA